MKKLLVNSALIAVGCMGLLVAGCGDVNGKFLRDKDGNVYQLQSCLWRACSVKDVDIEELERTLKEIEQTKGS